MLCPVIAAQQPGDVDTPKVVHYFQFEVLVFRNLDRAAQHEEKWRTERPRDRPNHALDLDQLVAAAKAQQAGTATPGDATTARPTGAAITAADNTIATVQPLPNIAPVPTGERKLNAIRQRLLRSSRYDVLYYQAWRQTLTGNNAGAPYRITGGIRYGDDHELDGHITFTLRRYLHFSVDLWLTNFVTGTTGGGQWSIDDDDSGWHLNDHTGARRFRSQYYDMLSERHLIVQTAHLDELRRMRSGELNYLDHPLFGMLVLVTPIQPPPTEVPNAPAPVTIGDAIVQLPASSASE